MMAFEDTWQLRKGMALQDKFIQACARLALPHSSGTPQSPQQDDEIVLDEPEQVGSESLTSCLTHIYQSPGRLHQCTRLRITQSFQTASLLLFCCLKILLLT